MAAAEDTGTNAAYASIGARYVLPFELADGVATYVSGEVGHQKVEKIGTFDVPDWTNWNVGAGVTYKNMTFDVKVHEQRSEPPLSAYSRKVREAGAANALS